MLATTGTAPLSTQDTQHPSYIRANNLLTDVLEEFSTTSLWFNTSIRTFNPNDEGKILIPSNAITCDPTDQFRQYSIRGQYLFDNDRYTDVIGEPVECILIYELTTEEMPPAAYQYIRAKARYEYFLDADGAGLKLQSYQRMYEKRYMDLVAMNIKMQDSNFFTSPAYYSFMYRRRGPGGYDYLTGTHRDTRALLGHRGFI